MALQGNVMSLCAGPSEDSKYYPFSFQRGLVSPGLSQQGIYKAEQAHDLDSHEPPSPKWISHWMWGTDHSCGQMAALPQGN